MDDFDESMDDITSTPTPNASADISTSEGSQMTSCGGELAIIIVSQNLCTIENLISPSRLTIV